MNTSILSQLLALYFAIMYCWQLSSSVKSLVWKKIIHIYQGFYRFRFLFFIFFHFFSFSLTNHDDAGDDDDELFLWYGGV